MRNVRMPPTDRGIGPPANQQKPRRGGRERDENHYGIDIGDRRQLDLSRNELCDGTLARLGRRGITPSWTLAMIPPTTAASNGTPIVSGMSSRRRIVAVR